MILSSVLGSVILANWIDDGMVAADAKDVKPIEVGKKIPTVAVNTVAGKSFELDKELLGKKTALVFYRGGWCPYCSTQLSGLGKVKDELKLAGYQILALSMDSPEVIKAGLEKSPKDYTILSDSEAKAAKAFGLAFRVDDSTYSMYKERFGLDLETMAGGQKHHILPVPAVFLVNEKGTITYSFWNPDYKVRLSSDELLKAAREN